jgi:hypothetical protein
LIDGKAAFSEILKLLYNTVGPHIPEDRNHSILHHKLEIYGVTGTTRELFSQPIVTDSNSFSIAAKLSLNLQTVYKWFKSTFAIIFQKPIVCSSKQKILLKGSDIGV